MIVYIANPLYDVVFKRIMEEERIAKTFWSAILQREVVSIKICQDGFRNIKSNSISIFKMGFVASIKNNGNSNELTNIRLYKTWVDTDILEPRQHLAWQRYTEENNPDDIGDESLPTISVFLLAHRIGDFETPVASPAPGSFIIQLPIISKVRNASQKKVLSIFNQARTCKEDKHLLKVDYTPYDGDTDIDYLIKMLLSMASDPDIQYQMNIEDEYISLLEKKDTQILQLDYLIEQSKLKEK